MKKFDEMTKAEKIEYLNHWLACPDVWGEERRELARKLYKLESEG